MSMLLAITLTSFLTGSVWCWVIASDRWRHGERLLPYERRRDVPWGAAELLLGMIVFLALQALAALALARSFHIQFGVSLAELPPDHRALVLGAGSLASLATFIVMVLVVRKISGANGRDLGTKPARLAHDFKLGGVAFLMLAPLVYGVQVALVQFLPSEHPLIELLKAAPDPRFLVLSCIAAVVIAPVVEEFFFRVLLQGWLEKVAAATHPAPTLQPRRWPIVASALVFAGIHIGHGPDPIPLFLLALGLGYLYQRTHRIFPCIVLHLLLNLVSMAALLAEVFRQA